MLTGGFATQAAVLKTLPYRPLEDFTFITSVVRYPIVYAVKPDSPIKSFKDYIERAKANPAKVSNGIAAAGSVYHLLGKWVDNLAGTEINLVFYRGTALALQDVLGGRIDVMTDAATSAIPRIRSGQLRALAVTSPERYPLLPDVPTMAETIPGIRVESWLGLASAPNIPKPIVDRLNAEINWALGLPDVKKWASDSGVLPAPSTPDEFRKRVEGDVKQWKEIVARNKISIRMKSKQTLWLWRSSEIRERKAFSLLAAPASLPETASSARPIAILPAAALPESPLQYLAPTG